jgi:hypothetical protein
MVRPGEAHVVWLLAARLVFLTRQLYSPRAAFFDPEGIQGFAISACWHKVRRKKQGQVTGNLEGDEMSEGALTKNFDLVPGKWRINASLAGYKVVGCALVGLRHRPFSLRQVEASEFTALVPFDVTAPVSTRSGSTISSGFVLYGRAVIASCARFFTKQRLCS